MVKLDLVTLSAPVTWIGPAGYGEGVWLCFLDFEGGLLRGAWGFLEVLELEDSRLGFLPLGETFVTLAGGEDFFFGFTGVTGAGFSGVGATSFTF